MNRPNHLIMKPIFAVMVFKHTFNKKLPTLDKEWKGWMDYQSMHRLWKQVKNQLKDKNFMDDLKEFDVRSVKKDDIQFVQKMFKDDRWMRDECIMKESRFALAMFRWINAVIEFADVSCDMASLGIDKLDDKIANAKGDIDQREKALSRKKMFKRIRINPQLEKEIEQASSSDSVSNLYTDDFEYSEFSKTNSDLPVLDENQELLNEEEMKNNDNEKVDEISFKLSEATQIKQTEE